MTYPGKVVSGVVVLDNGASLPEGTTVRVEPIERERPDADSGGPLAQKLLDLAGSAGPGLPSDLASNHDHYLYGGPKR